MIRFLTNLAVGLGSGFVGALALTAAHEALRGSTYPSPRMDVLGMRALKRGAKFLGISPPRGKALFRDAMVGDLVANTAWYGLVGSGMHPFSRGMTLGLLAGLGAVVLPPWLGLGQAPRGRTPLVQGETVALYLLGGLVTATVAWLGREVREGRLVDDVTQAASGVRARINARKSGLVH
jgi:hypothetical protein